MPELNGQNQRLTFPIALVVSRFNQSITSKLLEGARTRLIELGFEEKQVTIAHVPGAVEIPLIAQKLAALGHFQAIIALGAVIRGETSHYDYVCNQVSEGCAQVSLQNDVPVIFGVLTTQDEVQALDRVGGRHGHKGIDAVDAAVEMVALIQKLPGRF